MKTLFQLCCLLCAASVIAAAPIDLYIVCNTDGSNPVMTGADFESKLPTVNAYFAQVGDVKELIAKMQILGMAERT